MKSRFAFVVLTTLLIACVARASDPIATGGLVSYANGREIHTFLSNGTFSLPVVAEIATLVVAGGGGADGHFGGGGGGGGGLIYTNLTLSAGNYPVVVGAGGSGSTYAQPGNGSNSIFVEYTAVGGGAGSWYCGVFPGEFASSGGSGGGGWCDGAPVNGAAGTDGQGHAGGNGGNGVPYTGNPCGGGGGAGAPGQNGNAATRTGGRGGNGLAFDISGTLTYYAGGGGGSGLALQGGSAGTGGLGGGGAGSTGQGQDGTPNTGGGAGGGERIGWEYVPHGASGGSGIVIVSIVPPTNTVQVTGALDGASPADGSYRFGYGSIVQATASSPVVTGETQYVCKGAIVAGNDWSQDSLTSLTLTLTNNALLTWQWETQYWLDAGTDGCGSVTAGGWRSAGDTATFTASPDSHWHLAAWSGDTNGCQLTGSSIMVPVDGPRDVRAVFAMDQMHLFVSTAYGVASPGSVSAEYGAEVEESVSGSPVVSGTTRHVCTGAAVAGNDWAANSATDVSMVLTNDASMTWQWQTQYLLVTTNNGSGTVTPGGWQADGSVVVLTATHPGWSHLVAWIGDTNECIVTGDTISVPMTRARAITAIFGAGAAPVVSGTITEKKVNAGVAGVTLLFSGVGSTTTDANGEYALEVPYGWTGTVTPSTNEFDGAFSPGSRTFKSLTKNATKQKFIWTPPPVVSGSVVAGKPLAGVSGVTIVFSGLGVTTTDGNGNYAVTVPYNWTGTVTPSTNGIGGRYTPADHYYKNLKSGAVNQKYTWKAP